MIELLQDFSDEHRVNIQRNRNILVERNIYFVVESSNKYLVQNFEFYPSSGIFENKITGEHGKGIFNLLKLLEIKN